MDEFLEFLPDNELKIVEFLRNLVFNCTLNCIEKLSYNVPFYKLNKNICFIWPASVLWGKTKSYNSVRPGFTNGYLMQDEIGYLDKGDRKQVYCKDFTNIREIEVDVLKSYIFEAAMIDQQLKK